MYVVDEVKNNKQNILEEKKLFFDLEAAFLCYEKCFIWKFLLILSYFLQASSSIVWYCPL
jgi:hypothetical protein